MRLLIAFQNHSNDEVHHHDGYDQGVGHLKGSFFIVFKIGEAMWKQPYFLLGSFEELSFRYGV